MITTTPTLPATSIKRNLLESDISLSVTQIKEVLVKNFGLRARRPAKKPLLTERMRKQRLLFVERYENWGPAEWRKVMFSDESSFEQFQQRNQHVRRPDGQRYNPRYTVATVKHPPKVMVWGCFSAFNSGGLFFLPPKTNMNGKTYLQLLKDKLHLHMNIHQTTHFLHDSAPCHTSRIVTSWLKQQKIEVITWPGNSPDLNPIENLWNNLKCMVSRDNPSSLPELQNSIRRNWCLQVTPEYCQALSDSMPRRVQKVKKAKGWMTKY